MRRRDFILLAGAALALPRWATAQQPERVRRIGYLTMATGAPEDVLGVVQTRGLVDGLRELGWFDGRNISIEHRFSGSGGEKIRTNAKALVALNPDVIVCVGGPSLAALLAETRAIPIVFVNVNDPVSAGYVASLAHPGGNATGIAVSEAPPATKWLQLLKETAPQITRVLAPIEADSKSQRLYADAVTAAAASFSVAPVLSAIGDIANYEREVGAFAQQPEGGLIVVPNGVANSNMERIHALAIRYRLPAIYSYPINVRTGGLISYGVDNVASFHDGARYVDQILRGAKPGDLPVQQPARFVLAVNLKTAKAIGLTVPQSILARADEVIE